MRRISYNSLFPGVKAYPVFRAVFHIISIYNVGSFFRPCIFVIAFFAVRIAVFRTQPYPCRKLSCRAYIEKAKVCAQHYGSNVYFRSFSPDFKLRIISKLYRVVIVNKIFIASEDMPSCQFFCIFIFK